MKYLYFNKGLKSHIHKFKIQNALKTKSLASSTFDKKLEINWFEVIQSLYLFHFIWIFIALLQKCSCVWLGGDVPDSAGGVPYFMIYTPTIHSEVYVNYSES